MIKEEALKVFKENWNNMLEGTLEDNLEFYKAQDILNKEYSLKELTQIISTISPADSKIACDKLYELLKDFTIWKVGKLDNDLLDASSKIKGKDRNYNFRTLLYKDLMQLEKYKKMSEDEKIVVAMQLGALDFSSLMK